MTPDVLDRNLERLMAVAPRRERLSDVARARIRRALHEQVAAPRAEPPRHRLRRLPLVAAAAALLLVSLGAWRWLSPSGDAENTGALDPRSGLASAGPEEPAEPGAGTSTASPGTERSPDPVGLDRTDRVLEGSGREPLLAAEDPEEPSREPEPARGEPEAANARPEPDGTSVLAAVTFARDSAGAHSPGGMAGPLTVKDRLMATLWVKPIVQLPRVAGPVAFEIRLVFTSSEEDPGPVAWLRAEDALGVAEQMGAEQVLLQLEAPGLAPARARVSRAAAASGDLRFELETGVSVSGVVIDAVDRNPVPGALVVALDQLPLDALDVAVDPGETRLPRPHTVADSLGRFTLEHVATGSRVRIRASAPGLAPTLVSTSANATSPGPLQIELTQGSTVVGLVERPDGSSWSGAYVIVSKQEVDPASMDRPVMTFGADTCDRDGEFRIEGLPEGQYVALLFDPAQTRSPLEFRQLRLDGKSETRTDFRAPVAALGLTLKGTLTDVAGKAVARASLTLATLDGGLEQDGDWRVTETSPTGAFQFVGIKPSDYLIYLASDGFGQMNVIWEGRISDSQDVSLVLPATEVMIDARGGTGEGPSWVVLDRWRPESSEWIYGGRSATVDEDGHRMARLEHLLPGRHRAVVVGPDHGATWTEAFELEVGRPKSLPVALLPGGPITLRAVDQETGEALPGLVVAALDADGTAVPQQETILTGPDGRARILSVPHGTVTLRLREKGSAEAPLWEKAVDFDESSGEFECRVPSR
ncbi:hypothetical protein Poly30_29500 [Planctomycetes bacterium Poly30]|uniref:Nickel uptake substrate-specific transmembrane region n=1 Tax=Saltatorellus ferox TaxID=2528018 RepID=A0A518ETL7_9BACT|nr:hypothetical protein Poly30_29500 [Planctomycetes bacterium Poly30]